MYMYIVHQYTYQFELAHMTEKGRYSKYIILYMKSNYDIGIFER